MERIQRLVLPEELESAHDARDEVLRLHDAVIDMECDIEQLEARKKRDMKRAMPSPVTAP